MTTKEKIKKHKFIPGTFDLAFKEIITSDDCKHYTCSLISNLLGIDEEFLFENLYISNSNIPIENLAEKAKDTDVLLTVEGTIINLEMNKDYYEGVFKKNDIYQHTLISRTVKSGEIYLELKQIIQINIDDFSKFKKPISKFVLMEEETGEIENTDYIKYHISLPKIAERYYNGSGETYLDKLLLVLKLEKKRIK